MIAAAFRYADNGGGGKRPDELELLTLIERFGAVSIYGRPIAANEIVRLNASENIVIFYEERRSAATWDAWVADNPQKATLLAAAQIAADELFPDG